MSDYHKMKVVRYKLTPDDLAHYQVPDTYSMEDKFSEVFQRNEIHFEPALTDTPIYLDCILEEDDGEGDYGKSRALYPEEKSKFGAMLQTLFAEMDKQMGNVHQRLPDLRNLRLVEFCWYDCTEAPDYFDENDEDPFYKSVA